MARNRDVFEIISGMEEPIRRVKDLAEALHFMGD
jgi:hypothetical protein